MSVVYCKPVLFDGGHEPVYQTKEAACADLYLPEDVTFKPHEAVRVNLKLGFEIPNGYKILMYPRSSLLIKYGLMQPVSVIDSDYSGMPVHVPIFNLLDTEVTLHAGDRICQVECVPAYNVSWTRISAERTGGFGSTGGTK